MKILYSQLKQLIPGLKADPKEVGHVLTMNGFMMDGFEEVEYTGKADNLMSFEIRQNRADCLSVIGLARETAAYYGLKLDLPKIGKISFTKEPLSIEVNAREKIKRIAAAEISGIKKAGSPPWLKELLELEGIKSINLLVDLSNYVMLFTGYPSHLLDVDKLSKPIAWSLNDKFNQVTTLDGTKVELNKKNELIIHDDKKILALAGMVGADSATITEETTNVIAEMALYDRALIHDNSRSLRIITEASNRLEKDLDPSGIDYAFDLLLSLILEQAGGRLASSRFEYYPAKDKAVNIVFDPATPSIFSGIEIPEERAIEVLKNLRFTVEKNGKKYLVTVPADRLDVTMPEDVVEEVVRFVGYENIPADEVPSLPITPDITPRVISLAEKIRDILPVLGFDEVLSWPLTNSALNSKTNYLDWGKISTVNSVNEESPDLRQSIAASLFFQLEEYKKKGLEYISIFEIGHVFGKANGKYLEHEALGIMSHESDNTKNFENFRSDVEKMLRYLGISDIDYKKAARTPRTANPYSAWDIQIHGKILGTIYKSAEEKAGATYFAELNLTETAEILKEIKNNPAVELTQKLVTLDANVEIAENESISKAISGVKKQIKPSNLWSIRILDAFPLQDKTRYTIRVTYQEMSDQEAKELHRKVFNIQG